MTLNSLTADEHEVIEMLGRASSLFCSRVVGQSSDTRPHDINEFCSRIHDLQARVMAQAAARSYPDRYRLAGETLGGGG